MATVPQRERLDSVRQTKRGDLSAFTDDSLRLVIEEGRSQIDAQAERFHHITDRAQTLLTVGLVAVAFAASVTTRLDQVSGARLIVATCTCALGGALLVVGIGAAAATATVRADFTRVDTTQMTTWSEPVLRQLASEYSEAVILGETTVAARLTLFRHATRFVCWGVLLAAVAVVIAV